MSRGLDLLANGGGLEKAAALTSPQTVALISQQTVGLNEPRTAALTLPQTVALIEPHGESGLGTLAKLLRRRVCLELCRWSEPLGQYVEVSQGGVSWGDGVPSSWSGMKRINSICSMKSSTYRSNL